MRDAAQHSSRRRRLRRSFNRTAAEKTQPDVYFRRRATAIGIVYIFTWHSATRESFFSVIGAAARDPCGLCRRRRTFLFVRFRNSSNRYDRLLESMHRKIKPRTVNEDRHRWSMTYNEHSIRRTFTGVSLQQYYCYYSYEETIIIEVSEQKPYSVTADCVRVRVLGILSGTRPNRFLDYFCYLINLRSLILFAEISWSWNVICETKKYAKKIRAKSLL